MCYNKDLYCFQMVLCSNFDRIIVRYDKFLVGIISP